MVDVMSEVLAALPEVSDQHAFNLARWGELSADPFLASLDGRIETNRHGQIVMMPPSGFQHSRFQTKVIHLLKERMGGGEGDPLAECPVSTTGGVKGIDIVWVSRRRVEEGWRNNVLTIAPEICVEVLSPANTRAEIEEQKRLYFEAGADEVWIVSPEGMVAFFDADGEQARSARCPTFPATIEL